MTDQMTNIQEIKSKIAKFAKERDWFQYHNPKNLSMSIAIEASELMEIFQWSTAEESWDISRSNVRTHIEEELSDVMIYCLSLANQLDIDVASAIQDKLIKNGIKYPGLNK